MENKKVTPTEIAEELLKSEDPMLLFEELSNFLSKKLTREWNHHLMGLWISIMCGYGYVCIIMFLYHACSTFFFFFLGVTLYHVV